VLISGVVADAPAAKAGLKPGDVLTRVGDTPVATPAQLLAAVSALKPKTGTQVTVQRAGQELDIAITVAQRPKPQVERD